MSGVAFHGHRVATWDPGKKKYVGSWTDSMSQGLAVGESTRNAEAKEMTGWIEGRDMTGTVVKTRSVVAYGEGGRRVFTAYAPGPDSKEMQVMRIPTRADTDGCCKWRRRE